MEPDRKNLEPLNHTQASGPIGLPSRPPHPNPKLLAEMIVPLLRERAHQTLRELESTICTPKSGAFIVVRGPESEESFGQSAGNQSAQSTKGKLALIQAIEHAREELSRAEAMHSSAAVLTVWNTLIVPLIDNAIKLLKQNETNSLSLMSQFRDEILSGLEQVNHKEKEDPSEPSEVSDFLKNFAAHFSDLSRQMGRRERTRLSTLRYDPYGQLAECRLNEVALDLKLHGIEIEMDEREPVVLLGEDDLKSVVSFYANQAKDWLKEIKAQIFSELIDPVNTMYIQDNAAFRAYCEAVRDQEGLACSIPGSEEIQLTAKITSEITIDPRRVQQRIEELLSPAKLFTNTLGISHRIEFERQDDAILVKLRILLPTEGSRYEPQDFSARKQDLERLRKPSLFNPGEMLLGMSPDNLPPELVEEGATLRPSGLVLSVTKESEIFVSQDAVETLERTELLKILRVVHELTLRQPSIIHGVINLTPEGSLAAQVVGAHTPIIYLNENPRFAGTALDRYREFLEKKRVCTESFDPNEELQTMAELLRPSETAFRGAVNLDKLDLVLKQIAEFPEFISCRNVRLKLFALAPNTFLSVMQLANDLKEQLAVSGLTLCELPPWTIGASTEQLTYILLTDDLIPVTQITVDPQRNEVTNKPFATELLRKLRDRVMSGLQQVHQLPASRIRRREVDEAMLEASLDLSDTLINELTILANSWRGKEIPASRVSLLLNSNLLDPLFSITEDNQMIRYLHEAELEAQDT